jgi:hypothetical protein
MQEFRKITIEPEAATIFHPLCGANLVTVHTAEPVLAKASQTVFAKRLTPGR